MLKTIPDITIAVDGYSATGKSTFAKMVAKDFGFLYLDSGALYRAVTLFALEQGYAHGDRVDTDRLIPALEGLDVHFGEGSKTFIAGRSVEDSIRTLRVSSSVSPVAAIPQVRAYVDRILHESGRNGRVIMDGRDIGTTVFPDAELKIFVVADEQVRAQRRYDELVSKGQSPKMDEVLANLRERDYIDSHRETSPLRRAEDAFVMDNSDMTLHEELVWLRGLVMGRFGILD